MLMLEAPIDCDEYFKLFFNEVQQQMILQPVPAKFKSGLNVVTSENVRRLRINTGV
jgi:hypothetical protein